MPERVELGVGGRERRGVEVAEPDDGDARDQVEVARAVVVATSQQPSPRTSVTSVRA